MAQTKVSALTELTTTDGAEELLVNDGGTSKKVTIANLLHDESIDSDHYVDGSIDNAHLADDAVDSDEIADGAIDLAHMSSESVDEDNLYISNTGSNGEFLSKQSGNDGGLTWATPTDTNTMGSGFTVSATTDTTPTTITQGDDLMFTAGTGITCETTADGTVTITNTVTDTTNDVVDDTSPQLGGFLDANGNYIQTEKGGDIASASPTVIDTDGDYFDVTGTTNFAAFTVAADRQFTLQFDGILTMTHHATNLDLPGEDDITTAAGDVATFQSTAANQVQCINYTRADGTAIVGASGVTLGFFEHTHTISSDLTISTDYNALSASPITIDTGYSVTVPTGSTWVIV
jgi:hypothetical protein